MKKRIENIDFETTELLENTSVHDQTYLAVGYNDRGDRFEGVAQVSCGEIIEVLDIVEADENNFIVECNVCKQQYENWTGSTPCCGSIAFLVEYGKVTDNISLFASINGSPIKPTKIQLNKK